MVITKSLPLDTDHFNFDLTEGFEMAVEKDWNVLDIATINKDFPIYDADLRPHLPSKYAVRLFFKACIPMCYVDPETYETNPLVKDANNASFEGKYLDLIDGTVLGSPVDKMSQGSTSEQSYGEFGYHGLLIADDVPDNKEAYALPEYRKLNHTNITLHDFATGSSIASCKLDGGYYQPKDIALYTENVKGFAYMLMNKGGYNTGGVASFIVNNGALAYSIDTSGNRMNLPLDDDYVENYKYLQPLLFKPFGVAFADHLTINGGTEVDTAGWFYCVLGVNEINDDPTYDTETEPVAGNVTLFGHLVSTFQSDVAIIDNSIVGNLAYIEDFAPSGPLAGSGWYLALQFDDIPEEADSVKVGLNPSQGTGLVEILTDPDRNGVFKITDKDEQVFVIKSSINGEYHYQIYDLSNLVCEEPPAPTGPVIYDESVDLTAAGDSAVIKRALLTDGTDVYALDASNLYKYDVENDSWTTVDTDSFIANNSPSGSMARQAVMINGYIYTVDFGGSGWKHFYKIDPTDGTITDLGNTGAPTGYSAGMCTDGTYIYMYDKNNHAMEKFTITGNSVSRQTILDNITEFSTNYMSTIYYDGNLFAICNNKLYKIDITNSTITELSSDITNDSEFCESFDGFYIIGGDTAGTANKVWFCDGTDLTEIKEVDDYHRGAAYVIFDGVMYEWRTEDNTGTLLNTFKEVGYNFVPEDEEP